MGNENEISVDLRLSLDALKEDIRRAAAQVKAGMSSDMGAAAAAGKAEDAQKRVRVATEKTTSALQKQIAEWRKLNAGGVIPGMKITDASKSSATGSNFNPFAATAGGNTGGGLATGAALPTPPAYQRRPVQPPPLPKVVTPSVQPSAAIPVAQTSQWKQIFGAALGTGFGGPLGGAVGGLLTKANPAVAATVAAMSVLRMAVQSLAKAVMDARALYVKSATSGIGLQASAKRQVISGALGVSEDELGKFGLQIQFIGDKANLASKVMAENATPLTQLANTWDLMKANVKALWTEIAGILQPTLIKLVNLLRGMSAAVLYVIRDLSSGLKALTGGLFKAITPELAATLDLLDKVKNPTGAQMSGPTSFMKQMPASAWERMGLVVGGGGGTNYAQQTAKNTQATSVLLQKVVEALGGGGSMRVTKQTPAPSTP